MWKMGKQDDPEIHAKQRTDTRDKEVISRFTNAQLGRRSQFPIDCTRFVKV